MSSKDSGEKSASASSPVHAGAGAPASDDAEAVQLHKKSVHDLVILDDGSRYYTGPGAKPCWIVPIDVVIKMLRPFSALLRQFWERHPDAKGNKYTAELVRVLAAFHEKTGHHLSNSRKWVRTLRLILVDSLPKEAYVLIKSSNDKLTAAGIKARHRWRIQIEDVEWFLYTQGGMSAGTGSGTSALLWGVPEFWSEMCGDPLEDWDQEAEDEARKGMYTDADKAWLEHFE